MAPRPLHSQCGAKHNRHYFPRSQTICSTMLGTRQLLLVEVPHARMRSEWHQLRRQLMQQQQHGKAMNYSNIPHCLRRAADPPFYPVSWVPTPPLSGKAAVYSSGSARAQRTRERKKIKQRRQICCSAKVIEKSLWRHVESTASKRNVIYVTDEVELFRFAVGPGGAPYKIAGVEFRAGKAPL